MTDVPVDADVPLQLNTRDSDARPTGVGGRASQRSLRWTSYVTRVPAATDER